MILCIAPCFRVQRLKAPAQTRPGLIANRQAIHQRIGWSAVYAMTMDVNQIRITQVAATATEARGRLLTTVPSRITIALPFRMSMTIPRAQRVLGARRARTAVLRRTALRIVMVWTTGVGWRAVMILTARGRGMACVDRGPPPARSSPIAIPLASRVGLRTFTVVTQGSACVTGLFAWRRRVVACARVTRVS